VKEWRKFHDVGRRLGELRNPRAAPTGCQLETTPDLEKRPLRHCNPRNGIDSGRERITDLSAVRKQSKARADGNTSFRMLLCRREAPQSVRGDEEQRIGDRKAHDRQNDRIRGDGQRKTEFLPRPGGNLAIAFGDKGEQTAKGIRRLKRNLLSAQIGERGDDLLTLRRLDPARAVRGCAPSIRGRPLCRNLSGARPHRNDVRPL
jgi:hypothetical protein